MAYFNHAFCKNFLATSYDAAGGTATSALTSGQVAVVAESSWQSIATGSLGTTTEKHLVLVQGSLRTNDNIGNNPGHGGYAESVKGKAINPKYISRLAESTCNVGQQPAASISVASDCAPCGENLFLRMDVKGSPALRYLNHNAYAIGDSSGDAAAFDGSLPGLCCIEGQEYLDPAVALAAAMNQVLADPIVSPFVAEGSNITALTLGAVTGTGYTTAAGVATTGGAGSGLTLNITAAAGNVTAVTIANAGSGYEDGDVVTIVQGGGASDDETVTLTVATAGMVVTTAGVAEAYTLAEILDGTYSPSTDPVGDEVSASANVIGAYVDTSFGDCSFDTRDHYEKEPVTVILSILDETGDPCNDCGVATSTPGQMAETLGEKVLRDLILTDRYMQSPYNQGTADSARIREIEGSADVLAAVDRSALYKVYYIQHSVPRFNNPSGTFDNDQYLYQIYVACDDATTISRMDAMMTALETLSGVTFETLL